MELRHLRYFVAVVEWKGFREASRRLHVAQPAISATVSQLEDEVGSRLFDRAGRTVRLTPEGEIFYEETRRTLQQVRDAVDKTQRAARGETASLTIGFCGASTNFFLPGVIRNFKELHPYTRITLSEITALDPELAFEQGMIDVAVTRPMGLDKARYMSKLLYQESLFAALPASRGVREKSLKVESLAREQFHLFHRKGAPMLFDSIVGLCNDFGFSPDIVETPQTMQTVLTLVAADQGVSIVPACALALPSDGVEFRQLRQAKVKAEMHLLWPKGSRSSALRAFLDVMEANRSQIVQSLPKQA